MSSELCELNLAQVQHLLQERFGGMLKAGAHSEGSCEVCVRELRAIACELGWTDKPDNKNEMTATDRVCQSFNDAAWSNDAERTRACLPLALLSEHTAPKGWQQAFSLSIIREIVPIALRAAASIHPIAEHKEAMEKAAKECEENPSVPAARAAADAAAAAVAKAAAFAAFAEAAAYAAAYAAARAAADAAAFAADAARAAARAAFAARAARAADAAFAEKDKILRHAVRLLLLAHNRQDLVRSVPEEAK